MLLVAGGCPAPEDPAFVWSVTLEGQEDGCADGRAESYEERLDYVVQFDGNAARIAVLEGDTPVVFGVGTVAGCQLEYASVVWEDRRDGATIRWRLTGEATWRTGGDFACGLQPGTDWEGSEEIEVVASEHPEYRAGCRVRLLVSGAYQGPR